MSQKIIKTSDIPNDNQEIYLVQGIDENWDPALIETVWEKPELTDDQKNAIIKQKIDDLKYKLATVWLTDEEKTELQLLTS